MHWSRHITDTAKTFASNRRGGIAIYFALSLLAIAALFGMAFDFSRSVNLRTTLNAAADAAALATARDPDVTADNLQQRAQDFFMANMDGQHLGTNYTIAASELPNGNGVSIDVSAKIGTTMAALMGIDHFAVAAHSEAVYSTSKIELALVLDNTGSMSWSGKIQTLKTASHDMIDLLLADGPPSPNVKIGIVPFDIGVNVGTNNANASWMAPVSTNIWDGCVGPRTPSNDVKDTSATGAYPIPPIYYNQTGCTIPPILPMTNDKAALHQRIDAMQASGWTYIPEGLAWGWRVLSPSNPFTEGVAYTDPDWKKILVLMTDGANTVQWNWYNFGPWAFKGVGSSVGDSKTTTLCNSIKAQGILVYTVAFQVGSSSTRQMLQDCATVPGNYFDAQNNAQLEAAFAKIGGDINNLRLSK